MKNALIGFSGFVGATLQKQALFDALYRSTNIADIEGGEFDLAVCAGAPAQKWIANREHWQKQFSAAVAQRQSPEFPQRIETLLVNRESLWTPAYRQAFASTEAQARSLFVDLMAESTPAQRERLLKKIEGVRKDFNDLKCLKAAQQN